MKLRLQENEVVTASTIDHTQFIDKMEGFIKDGSKVEKMDPLKLKEIWMVR